RALGFVALAASSAIVLVAEGGRAQALPPTGTSSDTTYEGTAPTTSKPSGLGARQHDADEDRDGVPWRPRRELRWETADFVVTGAAAGVVIGGAALSPHSRRWRGGILFDE